ncbi:probable glucan endo-1,3-beta-glucosidase A6 isoform X1 [Nymphaea colorata]|nr:probable glucan endo-1,3-beta-glucosidase A6 isoform X1 [Nymphaea colorata]XP_031476300.1 probable glucan endo-1,3-beta-glucosidase A6 isoform X1 [Nymphaea colorata]
MAHTMELGETNLDVLNKLKSGSLSTHIGINYGQLGDNLPPPSRSIELIKSLKASSVKIYDANPAVLEALCGTSLKVSIMVPNQAIVNISASERAAHAWVRTNLLPFYRRVRIRTLLVGNEVLSDHANRPTWFHLVPAMLNIKRALASLRVRNVKVGTTFAMDTLESSFPPSRGTFRRDIAVPVVLPLLKFLSMTGSSFFLDVYPYFVWSASPNLIPLDYALFRTAKPTYTDPVNGLRYTNLLDQMLDSVVAAMAKLGFKNMPITIAETGWPNAGDLDQMGANIENAAVYNRNLARHLAARVGTPARPGMPIRTFLFALYNEDRKDGPGTERHWGLFYANGSAVYEVDLTGKRSDLAYRPLPKATNNRPYRGKIWCVADPAVVGRGANARRVTDAVRFACSQGNQTCEEMRPGKGCSLPRTPVNHASYAFNAYWQQFRKSGATCYFGGLAVQTATDPSYGSCTYPALSS